MEYRTLDLTLISANGLKKSHLNKNMEVYAVASISCSNRDFFKYRTPVDKHGGSEPRWNHPIKFNIEESLAQQNRLTLIAKIKSVGLFWDKKLGEVRVPIKELFEGVTKEGKPLQNTSYQVTRPSGKNDGILSFSYKIGELFQEPVTAYPAAGGVYPPQRQPPVYGGYPAQAPVGYGGYPPPPPPVYGGYAQPQPVVVQQRPASNYSGLGMGLGAGLLGGLLISDIASHSGGGCGSGCGGGCGGGGCGGGCGG